METLRSDYGNVSVHANARIIHLAATTGSGDGLSFCALCSHSTGHSFTVIFLTNRTPGSAAMFTYSPAHFRRQSDAARRDVDRMLASSGVPSECAPAVQYFCTLTTGIVAAKRWCCATVVVKMSASRTDVGIETVRYGEAAASMVREDACGICFEEFVEGVEVGRMQCSHAYHYACLRQWLVRKRSCPYCREPV